MSEVCNKHAAIFDGNLCPARCWGGKARGFQKEIVSGNRTATRQTGCLLDREASTFAEAMVDRKV
jgi:hypothetical protein